MSLPTAPLPAELIDAVQSQRAILFLGAAASFGAVHPRGEKIPGGDRLRDALCDRFLGGEFKNKPLATVAEYAVNEANLVSVQRHVREMLQDFEPADFHNLIPRFRWHGIVTTNYDLIIERAYALDKKPVQQLVPFFKDGDPIETEMKRAVDGVPYLKLHGCIDHYSDEAIPLILATEQYARYSTNRTRLFSRFQDWGREFPVIFCGYSVSDPHIQAILLGLFEMNPKRPMYYIVDPSFLPVEERYWNARRTAPICATFAQFLFSLDAAVSVASRSLPTSLGGGSSTLRTHYKVVNVPESKALFFSLAEDVEHIRKGIPLNAADPKDFYRGANDGWGAIEQNLDVLRSVTDNLVVDAVLAQEAERSGPTDFFAVKGPAGNGKTVVLMRAAWMAAMDYGKIVLFLKSGGTIRNDVIEEIYRYTQERIFLFVDKAALYVDEIRSLLEFARGKKIPLTLVVAERDAEWYVRCESLDKYGVRDFSVRYLSEREVRDLLRKLEQHDSLGLLREVPDFEERVQRLMGGAQRQLLVALHEATFGKAFEDIVFDEYQRIIPPEAQALYLDICTLNRLGSPVRAGLIARVSGVDFTDFKRRFFKPLAHIVSARVDPYSGDYVYAARHEHVAEMVFERVLAEPEARYDQLIRILGGMNLDYSSDRRAFAQMIRGHSISDALRSRELGRAFFEAAAKVAPREAFLFQQRGVFEMQSGGDLSLAEKHLETALSLGPHNRSIQHSLATLARRQALATVNPLLRKQQRDRAKRHLAPLLGSAAEDSYGFHTAAQIALDDLRDILDALDSTNPDPLLVKRLVDTARDFERYVQEGLQKFPLNEHLLALEADYHNVADKYALAESALQKAFDANPRQDWVAIRLAKTLEKHGKPEQAKETLIRCLQDNPTSKRAHFELANWYMSHGKHADKEMIFNHLRRSFTAKDQNFDAQFWYAREAFLLGKMSEATQVFRALSNAPTQMQLQVRGIITDEAGRTKLFVGEVITIEDGYMFVRCADFADNIFIHRSRAGDVGWDEFSRTSKVVFTVGFNMRGPTGASVSLQSRSRL
jgi:tetratricopeptide (TPR) repeat protein